VRLHAERVAMLSHEAYHDMLTGLPNRRMVLEHLEAASQRAEENGLQLGVLFVDLDRFKHINDTYGHLIGDIVLKATADRLRSAVRGIDVAARLGGDEFVVVLEGLEGPEALHRAKARVQSALAGAIEVDDDVVLQLHASIGHVLARSGDAWQDLIERADLDMYRVKHLGRESDAPVRVPTQR
jgi:diguanylate cyclase (GGDEF)-like protein